ncbi:MAG: M20/M25/M40 family metallo-hydrolase [Bdellovibrionaceae bacterium]|nr:M20/M25/M40 family metallo-hydrolase [Pseudobdellovibrionaceae bacterium]
MKAILIVFLAVFCLAVQADEDRYLLLGDFLPELAREIGPNELVYAEGGVSLVRVPVSQVEQFSRIVHDHYKACGGFMDVTHEIRKGRSAARLVWEYADPKDSGFEFAVRGDAFVADMVSMVSKDAYWNVLKSLEAMGSRSATNAKGAAAQKWIQGQATELTSGMPNVRVWTVETDHFFANKQASVVLTLEGTQPNLPAVVLGAHMDTITQSFTSDKQPGADDDGSGSALLLETLRVLKQSGAKFERTVHLVWYAAEEWGLVGSQFVVDAFVDKGLAVDAVLQFDMVGYNSSADDDNIYLLTDYTNPALTETLRRVIETYTDAKVGTTECGYACSDHASWHKKGFAAAVPFEASFSNMNGRLHTQNDKTDVLDVDHAIRFVKSAVAFVGEVGRVLPPQPKH